MKNPTKTNICAAPFHYSVLYTNTFKQEKLAYVLRKSLPKERGRVIFPKLEWWRRDRKELELKPLFPGYLLLYSNLNRIEQHALVMENRNELSTYVRELGLKERPETKWPGEETVRDLTVEEAAFMDRMLDENGVLRMSLGYRDGKHIVVMKGPLAAYEKQIVDVDGHNRRAFLNLYFFGRTIRAGLELVPKRYFLSQEEVRLDTLSDGTIVDIEELKKRMGG